MPERMLEGWTTVRWARRLYQWAQHALRPRTLLPLCLSWLITIAIALGGVAFFVDAGILVRAGSTAVKALQSGFLRTYAALLIGGTAALALYFLISAR